MKKITGILFFVLVLFTTFFYSTIAIADDKPDQERRNDDRHNGSNFNSEKQLSKSACGERLGNPVIDVTQKVKNDVDSGFGTSAYFPGEANYWNVESYIRHIKVWSTGEETWCATVAYDGGRFNAFYKQTGPGGTGLIGPDVNGEMRGGYRATFSGTLTPGSWSTHGNVGTFDYDCDLHANCPGRVNWVTQYFPSYSAFDQPWWGWIYKAGSHGTWINAIDVLPAVSGNIL
ncbi:MAG: hypothetical protein ACD_12C00868G0004 [uncultured bacterium]|nr:MAG: hypothetical protein ACD_12C00868G0004 [uncultured bacterium]